MRDETCSVVRIGIECNDCNRDSISMMFVMNRSVLECKSERSVSKVVWIV